MEVGLGVGAAHDGAGEEGGAGGGKVEAPWGIHRGGPVLAAVVRGGRREAESEREEELAGGACLRPALG